MTQTTEPTLLVTGASGHLGRRVVELLLERGASASNIIATTRTPDALADFAARGVTVRHADFSQPETLASAFAGADRLLLISTDVADDKRLGLHLNAVRAAEAAGVGHVIYTSLVNPVDTPVTLAPDHAGTEQALEASSLGWTALRNNIYMDGLPRTLAQAVELGTLFNAVGSGAIAYVTREDCAQAAAGALLDGFEGRRTLDVTGPAAVSQQELVAITRELTGKPLEYVPLPVEVYTQNLVEVGLPQPVAELIASFDDAAAQDKFSVVTDVVAELSGKQPTSVREFLTAQKAALTAH